MQKNLTPKTAAAASASGAWSDVSGLANKLEAVEEVLGALFLMTDSIETNSHRLSFKRIIQVAEEELAYATGFIENDAARLRMAASMMRNTDRTKPSVSGSASSKSSARDPLSAAISAYRKGVDAFEMIKRDEYATLGGEEAVVAKTYGEPMDILSEWSKPAMSHDGALAALRLAHEENRTYSCSPMANAMLTAALAFFEQEVR